MSRTNFTVIVPVYNDPEGVQTTIKSIQPQLAQSSARLVVVDNDSTDKTPDIVRALNDNRITLYYETEFQSSYAARNTGIRNTEGDVLAFLDADETVAEDWLETALDEMENQNADYLGCNVELTLPEKTLIGRYNAHTGFPVKQYLKEQHYAPTCALLVRREVFEDVGLFDSRLISGGDKEFGERVHEAGYDQGYAENAIVRHPARTSFMALANKNFRVGRGFCQKQRYYPERYGKAGFPPRPSGPSGDEGAEAPDSIFTQFVFAFLSIAMLACRGFGYYYEFFLGEKRDDIPASTR